MGNREAATKVLLKYIDALCPGSENTKLYEDQLAAMNDEQFETYVSGIESGRYTLSFVMPNLNSKKLSVRRNLAIAKELKHDFFKRLWLTDPVSGRTYLTPVKYLIIKLPLRRQAQLLVKKMSTPDDNKHIDELTGQPTGVSKGSKMSFPELQVLYAQGMDRTIEELIKFRGGDQQGFNAMNRSIIEKGGVSLDAIMPQAGKVKSTTTLSTFLKAMHLDNNL